MNFFLLDKEQNIVSLLPEEAIIEAKLEEGINTAAKLNLSVDYTHKINNNIFYICVPTGRNDDSYLMLKIISETISNTQVDYVCLESAYDELSKYAYVQDLRPNNQTAPALVALVTNKTRWTVGVSDGQTTANMNFYYETVLQCLQDIVKQFNAELQFNVYIDSTTNKVNRRLINVYTQMGRRTGKRFEYGSNLLNVKREESADTIFTAIVGRGAGLESTDDQGNSTGGYTRRITFADVEWSKAKGDPLDKPKGQEWLEDPDATAQYGFSDGKPRIGLQVFEDIKDPNQLLWATYTALQQAKVPKVQFSASILDVGDLHLGDTVAIIRHDLGFEYFTRVFKVTRDLLDKNNNTVELGDNLTEENSITAQISRIEKTTAQNAQHIGVVMNAANGKNKVFYTNQLPETANKGDICYLDLGNGNTDEYIWNKGWQKVVSTADIDQINKQIKQNTEDTKQALNNANSAVDKANDAVNKAGFSSQEVSNLRDDLNHQEQSLNDQLSGLGFKQEQTDQKVQMLSTTVSINSTRSQTNSTAITQITAENGKLSTTIFGSDKPIIGAYQLLKDYYDDTLSNWQIIPTVAGNEQSEEPYTSSANAGMNGWNKNWHYQEFINCGAKYVFPKDKINVADCVSLKVACTYYPIGDNYNNPVPFTVGLWCFDKDNNKTDHVLWTDDTTNFYVWKTESKEFKVPAGTITIQPYIANLKYVNEIGSCSNALMYIDYSISGAKLLPPQKGLVSQIQQTADDVNIQIKDVKGDISSIEQRINGIQSTVTDKVNNVQSQTTQLAGQITSVIKDVDDIKKQADTNTMNLLENSDFLIQDNNNKIAAWQYDSSFGTSFRIFPDNPNNTAANSLQIDYSSCKQAVSDDLLSNIFKLPNDNGSTVNLSVGLWIKNYQPKSTLQVAIQVADNAQFNNATNDFLKLSGYDINSQDWQFVTANDSTTQPFARLRIFAQTPTDTEVLICQPQVNLGTKLAKYSVTPLDAAMLYNNINMIRGDISNLRQQTSSEITQLKDDINLRVQKGDVINQINIDTSGILISGEKIHITGQTTIDDAVIQDAMIGNLSADKITAGTLNAANLNVINLNGNSIVSNSITADKLAANSILVGLNSGLNNLSISPDNIAIYKDGKQVLYLDENGMCVTNADTGEQMGLISTLENDKDHRINGLMFGLNPEGNFMCWAVFNPNDKEYHDVLSYSRDGQAYGGRVGIITSAPLNIGDDIWFSGGAVKWRMYQSSSWMEMSEMTIGGQKGFYIGNDNTGITFGNDGELYLMRYGTSYKLGDILTAAHYWG